jgi:hypothetical protein
MQAVFQMKAVDSSRLPNKAKKKKKPKATQAK